MRPRKAFQRIDIETALALLTHDAPLVLDVRDRKSYMRDHIKGALNVSIANLTPVIESTPKLKPVLIYCYHGYASQEYAQVFTDFGFLAVYSLDGGFEAWSNQPPPSGVDDRAARLQDWLVRQGFGGNMSAIVANGTTPLMKASLNGEITIVNALIAADVDLARRNDDGNNALWLACVHDRFDIIDALIAAGIDLDNRNDNGATALMYAASAGKAAVVDRLLAAGADPMPETLDGFSALDMAATLECLALLRRACRAPGKANARAAMTGIAVTR